MGQITGRVLAELLLIPVHAYRVLRPLLGGPRCRYHPTCSTYAVAAVRLHGPLKGPILALWRVLRCNPWSLGGVDYACDQHVFPLRRHLPTVARETAKEG